MINMSDFEVDQTSWSLQGKTDCCPLPVVRFLYPHASQFSILSCPFHLTLRRVSERWQLSPHLEANNSNVKSICHWYRAPVPLLMTE